MKPWCAGTTGLRSVALAGLCTLLGSPAVRAEPAAGRQTAADRTRTSEARRHFQQGRELLAAGSYAEAIAEFETALSLKPSPELLFNIAQAYRLKGDTKQALETYKRFIQLRPQGPIADEARGHIDVLTKQIEDSERAAQAQEAEQQRQDAERQRREVERQRQDAERQREDAERQRHETAREDQAHRRRTGLIALGVGGVSVLTGTVLEAALGHALSGGSYNTADWIGIVTFDAGLFLLIPYGTIKILYNPDLGSFKPTPAPAPAVSKGVAFSLSF